jgi:hypothetical protein
MIWKKSKSDYLTRFKSLEGKRFYKNYIIVIIIIISSSSSSSSSSNITIMIPFSKILWSLYFS